MLLRPSALVIEDDAYAQRLISAVAERAGYNVTSAKTGAEAEAAADTVPFDIIIVDLNLPDVDGLQLIEQLRARPQLEDVPFLVCSGNVNMETIAGAGRLGALGFMRKPIDLQEMQRRLERSYDVLPLRWNSPTAHRNFEQRQGAIEALQRARNHLQQVIALLTPGEADSSTTPADAEPIADGDRAGANVEAPATQDLEDLDGDDGDHGDADDVLTLEDLLATLKLDSATIGAPRLERLISRLSADETGEHRDALVGALHVALKSLDDRAG